MIFFQLYGYLLNNYVLQDGHEDHLKIQSEIQKHISLHNAFSTIDPGGSYDIITAKCIRVLFDVLTSHNFASLCDLLCETFQCANAKVILDFCSVISKLANGVYKHSFELFDKDIQLVFFLITFSFLIYFIRLPIKHLFAISSS